MQTEVTNLMDVGPRAPASHDDDVIALSSKVERRRLLGAYYTPDDLARLLVQWALGQEIGSALDPSFGGAKRWWAWWRSAS